MLRVYNLIVCCYYADNKSFAKTGVITSDTAIMSGSLFSKSGSVAVCCLTWEIQITINVVLYRPTRFLVIYMCVVVKTKVATYKSAEL